MKLVACETLISRGTFPESEDWRCVFDGVCQEILRLAWPPGTKKFLIYPESGKESGAGNGVKPIKEGVIRGLVARGWKAEECLEIPGVKLRGKVDALVETAGGRVAVEWETGNISSSHRALNKMGLGLMKGALVGGILVVPTRDLYRFLTDRVGNLTELEPYFDVWRSLPVENGVLTVVAVEHDGTSKDVPRIPKGTDGRALR